jgi:AcrR family transcriptional regulator
MVTSAAEPAGPQPRRISREDIADVGVELTVAHGLQAVSVRAVASRLGVRSPSLYHHLPGGLDELQGLVVARVQQLLEAEEDGADGAEDPRDPAEPATVRDMIEGPLRLVGRASHRYPGVLEYILTTGKDSPTTLEGSSRTVLLLLDSELSDVAPEAYVAIHAYVTGWIFAQRPSSAAAQAHGLGPLADLLRAAESLDQQQVLFDGLRALLSGLAHARGETSDNRSRREPRRRRRT